MHCRRVSPELKTSHVNICHPYSFNMNAPETTEAFTDIAKFFDRYLAK